MLVSYLQKWFPVVARKKLNNTHIQVDALFFFLLAQSKWKQTRTNFAVNKRKIPFIRLVFVNPFTHWVFLHLFLLKANTKKHTKHILYFVGFLSVRLPFSASFKYLRFMSNISNALIAWMDRNSSIDVPAHDTYGRNTFFKVEFPNDRIFNWWDHVNCAIIFVQLKIST